MRQSSAFFTSDRGDRYSPNERSFLLANRLTPRNGTARGAIWCHGAGADADSVMFHPPAVELAKRGFLVLGVFAGGLRAWGNDASQTAITAAVAWLRGAGGASADPVVMLGGSMGSATALAWAAAHPSDVAVVEVALPIADVEAVRAANRGGFAAEIATAHTNLAGWIAARPTRNPVELAASLTMPVRLDYSTTDTIGLAAETLAFAEQLPDVTVASFGAAAHSYAGFEGWAAADWIRDHL